MMQWLGIAAAAVTTTTLVISPVATISIADTLTHLDYEDASAESGILLGGIYLVREDGRPEGPVCPFQVADDDSAVYKHSFAVRGSNALAELLPLLENFGSILGAPALRTGTSSQMPVVVTKHEIATSDLGARYAAYREANPTCARDVDAFITAGKCVKFVTETARFTTMSGVVEGYKTTSYCMAVPDRPQPLPPSHYSHQDVSALTIFKAYMKLIDMHLVEEDPKPA
jgi:hypothetical protein